MLERLVLVLPEWPLGVPERCLEWGVFRESSVGQPDVGVAPCLAQNPGAGYYPSMTPQAGPSQTQMSAAGFCPPWQIDFGTGEPAAAQDAQVTFRLAYTPQAAQLVPVERKERVSTGSEDGDTKRPNVKVPAAMASLLRRRRAVAGTP